MSIAVIAPLKFAFQDLVSVELALRFADMSGAGVWAEPKGGEDAQIEWTAVDGRRVLEIQVKGAQGAYGLAQLAEHLAHFPERQAKGTLLDRLLNLPERLALLVVTARGDDAVSPLIVADDWSGAVAPNPPPPETAQELARCLVSVANGLPQATGLFRARRAHLLNLAASDPDKLTDGLSRVSIIDRQTSPMVELRLEDRLRRRGVFSDRLRDGVARLTDALGQAKLPREDALPGMREALVALTPPSWSPLGYRARGDEADLQHELASEGAVLLSGPARVGKTWTARWLGGHLQREGFEIRSGSHLDEADRFLSDPSTASRAYLLDDPLGVRKSEANLSLRVMELQRLIDDLPAGRRLIVSQFEGPVLEHFRQHNLADCALGRWRWRQLGALSPPIAQAIWRDAATSAKVSAELIDRIEKLVLDRADLRDAGALTFLAVTTDRLPASASDGEVVAQARADAYDYARALADESPTAGALLECTALTTEIEVGVAPAELAFVLAGGDARPAMAPKFSVISVFDEPDPAQAPAYAEPPALAAADRDAVRLLIRRRVLDQRSGRMNFVHPYLRAGAQALLRPDLEEDVETLANRAGLALASPAPATSLAAARNLDWLWGQVSATPPGRDALVDAAQEGLRSVFPSTRDACFQFLMNRFPELTREVRGEITWWVGAVSIYLDEVEEVDAISVIQPSSRAFWDKASEATVKEIQPYLDAAERGLDFQLDFTVARRITDALGANPEKLSAALAERLLSVDQAVLRGAAAALWLSRPRDDDDLILNRIARDAAPVVARDTLTAVVEGWASFTEARRTRLTLILTSQARTPGAATMLFQRLSIFDRVEHFGEAPPWRLFSEVAPDVVSGLPERANFSDGRFLNAVMHALKEGEGERLEPLVERWIARLEGRLSESLPTEFELAAVNLVAEIVPEARRPALLQMVLAAPNTGARMVFLRDLVHHWEKLGPAERALVGGVIAGNRGDELWLKAVALTTADCPRELIDLVTGDAAALAGDVETLHPALGDELFAAAIHVWTGAPQPLWFLATHHGGAPIWAAAVRWAASGAARPGFEVAFSDRVLLATSDEELVAILDALPQEDLPRAFELMLRPLVIANGDWRSSAWARLLERGQAAGLADAWFSIMMDAAPMILADVSDVGHWLGKGASANKLLSGLDADLRALKLGLVVRDFHDGIETLSSERSAPRSPDATDPVGEDEEEGDAPGDEDDDDDDDEDEDEDEDEGTEADRLAATIREAQDELISRVIGEVEGHPPRLHGTWSRLSDLVRPCGVSDSVLETLERYRRQAVEAVHARERDLEHPEDQSALAGWIGPL